MNMGSAVLRTLEFSQELDLLHKHITGSGLPVSKSDSFDKQVILLEQYQGEDTFQSTYKTMKRVNILSGLFALPVLLIVAAAFIYGRYIDRDYDVFGYFVDHPVMYLVPAALIVVTLVLAMFHSALRRKLYGSIYPDLKRKLGMNAA
ncbi:DUF6097 family protein [Paenibacillus sp. MMS20-IR301]|uniref:DUF6097 family protein n=1 Tax=Paenibacillus sp. MMS20-IR301 TaxID=2895946 RepID=UPI0028E73EAA|nr:DUF6097 family protein [Paenibacillus sp. MMS20-IR301]WNS42332.1 DUF6097 family protein [Paenibacillus sp. MMS20-IR301]